MSRQKLPEDKKKPKISVSINKELLNIMQNRLEELEINRSKYIENLIRKDFEKQGIDISPDFTK